MSNSHSSTISFFSLRTPPPPSATPLENSSSGSSCFWRATNGGGDGTGTDAFDWFTSQNLPLFNKLQTLNSYSETSTPSKSRASCLLDFCRDSKVPCCLALNSSNKEIIHQNGHESACSSSAAVSPWSRSKRSLSLTTTLPPANQEWSSVCSTAAATHDDVFTHMKTFRCDGELSPQNSVCGGSGCGSTSSSGGENCDNQQTTSKRNSFAELGSGMKDVPIWLKSLRLHKYMPLFQQLSYDEMMELTEEQLESQGVTKGARHKIVLSIQKLKDRGTLLKQLLKDIVDVGCLKTTLNELKLMIGTPIRACQMKNKQDVDSEKSDLSSIESVDQIDDSNVPALFTVVLTRACMHLVTSSSVVGIDEDCFTLAIHLLDRCINHEAFAPQEKKCCLIMKQQIRRVWNPLNGVRKLGPRSNSWNKDRRQQNGGNHVTTTVVCSPSGSPIIGLQHLQQTNGTRPLRQIAKNCRSSNNMMTNFANGSQSKAVQVDLNVVSVNGCYGPSTMFSANNIINNHHHNNHNNNNNLNRSVFTAAAPNGGLDTFGESYLTDARSHAIVQRTISAPAFGPTVSALNNGVHNNQHNLLTMVPQQQNITMNGGGSVSSSNGNYFDSNKQYGPQSYFNLSLLQQENGGSKWCNSNSTNNNNDSSSIFSNGFHKPTQNSPIYQRSGCSSCGFEETLSCNSKGTMPGSGFVATVCGAGVGAIGSPRPTNGYNMQLNRQLAATQQQTSLNNHHIGRSLCSDLVNSSYHHPNGLTSTGALNGSAKDVNIWNMDQLYLRVVESAIE